jgi:hypothetical protein
MILEKYSFGIGDRFGRQGKAQLAAVMKARQQNVSITPVWNKSHREHSIVGTKPADVRKEADAAVKACKWNGPYFVDADHIGLGNVDEFIEASDFFTLDVADFIGQTVGESDVKSFVDKYRRYAGSLEIAGIDEAVEITQAQIKAIAGKFLLAVKQAGEIYRHIEAAKGADNFITEVSMDETDQPQTPIELLFILAAMADERVPAQTIAPKFTGRFNKGVDYVGDVGQFREEFEADLAIVAFAIEEFGLPKNLKLSVHSGSDKFSIYKEIGEAIRKFNAGVHVKTAGTTWLEEVIGLAAAGGEGLAIAKEFYGNALERIDELCAPYATVIDIDRAKLPGADEVEKWDERAFAAVLRHDPSCDRYDRNVRQLLHVGYKVAAEMSDRYFNALHKYEDVIARNVIENLYERHIRPIFGAS